MRLAFEEIRLAGAGSPQVTRRLEEVLQDLRTIAPSERQPVLDSELELLHAAVNDRYRDPRRGARTRSRPARSGHGAAALHRESTAPETDRDDRGTPVLDVTERFAAPPTTRQVLTHLAGTARRRFATDRGPTSAPMPRHRLLLREYAKRSLSSAAT